MSLIIHDEICLNTEIGVCKIQLCIGDITKLPKEESVDVLVVSAFPGDYSATPTSLIGALQRNLGVSVRNLSRDKEEDLRKQYYCWWSKALPEHLSFKRILCFEGGFGNYNRTPPQVIGAVFRCLVPILNNEEGSVMMPFLSTGDQGYSKKVVMKQTVKSAVHWIKAGLPLRTLKIVLFSRDPEKKDTVMQPLYDFFQELKQEYAEEEVPKVQPSEIMYDIYLSHSPKDHSTALEIVQFLKAANVSVFHDVQELNNEESWQEDMFNIMERCARVITLLGPAYLESDSCIEQYNMALCLSRRCHREVLAPLYIITVEILPTYMSLIQYIDCRIRDSEKMREASKGLVKWIETYKQQAESPLEQSPSSSQTPSSYDVFISYSHCNKTEALKALDALKSCAPELNVFIDTAALNTGTSWQQTLYHALDSSKRVLALLSPDYVKSKVCREEFCLAQALHMDKNSMLELQTLTIVSLDKMPDWCSYPLPVDCTAAREVGAEQKISAVCQELVRRLNDSNSTPDDALEDRLKEVKHKKVTIEDVTVQYRKFCFVSRTKVLKSPVTYSTREESEERVGHAQDMTHATTNGHQVSEQSPAVTSQSGECDLALSYAAQDSNLAVLLRRLLLEKLPHLKISEPQLNVTSRLVTLDVARLIVPLLSPAFLASKELMEELNIAVFRNRSASRQVIFPIHVAELPLKPSYIHLIPCEVSALDLSWAWKVMDQDSREEVERMAEEQDISNDVSFCLKSSVVAIVQRLTNGAHSDVPNQVLLNCDEVQNSWNEVLLRLEEEDVPKSLKRAFGVPVKGAGRKEEETKLARDKLEKDLARETLEPDDSLKGERVKIPETQGHPRKGAENRKLDTEQPH